MPYRNRLLRSCAALVILSSMLALSGCGGGGGASPPPPVGTPPPPPPPPPPPAATISGVAQKGPFEDNSAVSAYEIAADGTRTGEQVDVTTGALGQFTVDVD